MIADRPKLDERYSAATQSKRLTVPPSRCDVDLLIAAGWVEDGLGTMLFRLLGEWDRAAADYKLALRHARELDFDVARIRRNLLKRSPAATAAEAKLQADLLHQAELRQREAARVALTARTLAMAHLKTLPAARAELWAYAQWLAQKQHSSASTRQLLVLAAKALHLWLDSTCQACRGRGFNGGFHGARVLCTECGASGHAHLALARHERRADFVRALLADMDRKTHHVERAMARWLRQHPSN